MSDVVNVSVNSKPDHPPGRPWGFAHFSCPRGRVFAPLSCPGSAQGVLNQSKSSKILKKSAIFPLSLKQLRSSSFHVFIYARSEQRDLRRISCHGRNHSQASCEYSLTIFLCCQHHSEYSLLGSKFSTNLLFAASKYHVTIQ